MADTQFNFTQAGGDAETAVLTAIAGDFARVRFQSRPVGDIKLYLNITANGLENEVLIDEPDVWASGALASGDQIKLRAVVGVHPQSEAIGILEVTQ